MPDSARAIGWSAQAAIGTPVPPTVGANFVEAFAWNPNLKYRTPHYKRNSRLQDTNVIPTTIEQQITVSQADVDQTEFLPILASALGPAVSGVYKFGQATNATPTSFLTVKWSEGLGQSWQMQDSRVDTLKLTLDAANGTLRWNGTLVGLLSASQPGGTFPSGAYVLPAGLVPYAPWQVTCKLGSTIVQAISFELDLNNNFKPLFATAAATPGSGTPAGLNPVRFTDGMAEGSFKLTYEYAADAGSAFLDYRTNTTEAWHIIMTDAVNTHSITIDIPVVGWTQGQLDYTQAETRQVMSGSALFDSTAGTSVKVTVV